MHLKEGTSLQGGKYRIVRFINSGGFGCTYEAEHTAFRERVAVKEFFMRDFNERDGDSVTGGNSMGTYSNYKRKFVREADSLSKMGLS